MSKEWENVGNLVLVRADKTPLKVSEVDLMIRFFRDKVMAMIEEYNKNNSEERLEKLSLDKIVATIEDGKTNSLEEHMEKLSLDKVTATIEDGKKNNLEERKKKVMEYLESGKNNMENYRIELSAKLTGET